MRKKKQKLVNSSIEEFQIFSISISMYHTPTHTSEHNTEQTDTIDLSTTLVERRKRLHNLANEINNWEDESTPNKQ